MSEKVTDVKKNLTLSWRMLQDGTKADFQRESAYLDVIKYSNELRKLDKSFYLDEKALEKFSEFKPKNIPELDKKVKWTTEEPNVYLIRQYNKFVSTALEIVKERHPELDTDNDKFGTIVNATVANLIQLDITNGLNELVGVLGYKK